MKTMLFRMAVAVALAAGAWLSWSAAEAAERRAGAHQQIVTLRFEDVEPDVDAATAATVAYWLGQYGAVVGDTNSTEGDAQVLRTVANAAFRDAWREQTGAGSREPGTGNREPGSGNREPGTGSREPGAADAMVQRLDGVLQAYASALKASPRDLDAAYNYEYVARLRDRVARSPGKPLAPGPAVRRAGDLPAGPTIHGAPGMPPPDAKMEDLEMLAPLEYGDREAQPEATPGAKRDRKG